MQGTGIRGVSPSQDAGEFSRFAEDCQQRGRSERVGRHGGPAHQALRNNGPRVTPAREGGSEIPRGSTWLGLGIGSPEIWVLENMAHLAQASSTTGRVAAIPCRPLLAAPPPCTSCPPHLGHPHPIRRVPHTGKSLLGSLLHPDVPVGPPRAVLKPGAKAFVLPQVPAPKPAACRPPSPCTPWTSRWT